MVSFWYSYCLFNFPVQPPLRQIRYRRALSLQSLHMTLRPFEYSGFQDHGTYHSLRRYNIRPSFSKALPRTMQRSLSLIAVCLQILHWLSKGIPDSFAVDVAARLSVVPFRDVNDNRAILKKVLLEGGQQGAHVLVTCALPIGALGAALVIREWSNYGHEVFLVLISAKIHMIIGSITCKGKA